VPVPDFAVRAAYDARYGSREIEYATVNFDDFKIAKPTDDQLKDFYKQNPQTVPEVRTVSYVFIPAEMSQPDKYDAGYATAVKVEDDIIAGETMADAAKKHGAKYVALPAFARDSRPVDKLLTDKMVAKIFDMDAGLESEMIETKDGFVFVRVDKIVPAHVAEFEDVKKSLVADWKRAEQKKQAYVRANEMLVDWKKDGSLANKKNATVSRTKGAPTELLVAAFRGDIDAKSIVPAADAFYVLKVAKAVAPKVDDKKMAELRQEMQNMNDTGVKDDYNSFLQRQYPVQVNEKVFNRFFAN
jgi:hypothetical protein